MLTVRLVGDPSVVTDKLAAMGRVMAKVSVAYRSQVAEMASQVAGYDRPKRPHLYLVPSED